jgi:benzoate-CoA ligase family protein
MRAGEHVMTAFSTAELAATPPRVDFPRPYNAAVDLVERNLAKRRSHTAFIDDRGRLTYGELAERVGRAASALRALGLQEEQRVVLLMLDTTDFPVAFLGAIRAGLVAVPLNTLLTTDDYGFMLRDSRARALIVSDALFDKIRPLLGSLPRLEHVIVAGEGASHGHNRFDDLLAEASPVAEPAETSPDDVAFWLYSSGSTGRPKGALHLHADLANTAALYGQAVLGVRPDDVVFSAAKLFFAYGLGNALTFPLYVGATAVLMAERPTPQSVMARLKQHKPSIFYGVPTLYGAMLAEPGIVDPAVSRALRACVSAGEALPEELGRRWKQRFGVDILDGIGSTEMLHIFLSNRPGDVRYGASGKPVAGYEVRIVDEAGEPAKPGEVGDLLVKGPSSAPAYWNNRARSLATFLGPWTRTGDKYLQDADGYYVYAGRSDDMLKVSGNWVSPFEVESALLAHPAVLEAAVVGHADADKLIKPKAFVVLREGEKAGADELQRFVKDRLAPYKYPRWVEFVPELPKTATGKIQRFKLRT